MILVDAGPIIALADRDDPLRPDVRRILYGETGPALIPAPVTAEIDYMLQRRFGPDASTIFLADLADGNYQVECLLQHEFAQILALSRRYAALAPGLADLSLVALAARFDTTRILTFDERHFRAIEPLQGGAFTLLPFDA